MPPRAVKEDDIHAIESDAVSFGHEEPVADTNSDGELGLYQVFLSMRGVDKMNRRVMSCTLIRRENDAKMILE